MVQKFKDNKKATYQYSSLSKSEVSYKGCPNNVKEAMSGYMSTNDSSKSSVASLTIQSDLYDQISLHAAVGVNNCACNNFVNVL